MNIKDTLNKFYEKVKPERIDYSCSSDEEINARIRIRDAFMNESLKYQEMIDRKIMEKFDGLKYKGQYIKYYDSGEDYAISYIKCTKVERLIYGIKIKGLIYTIYTDGRLDIDMTDTSSITVNYSDIDEELEIISEEEYAKNITEAVNNIYEKFFEKLK